MKNMQINVTNKNWWNRMYPKRSETCCGKVIASLDTYYSLIEYRSHVTGHILQKIPNSLHIFCFFTYPYGYLRMDLFVSSVSWMYFWLYLVFIAEFNRCNNKYVYRRKVRFSVLSDGIIYPGIIIGSIWIYFRNSKNYVDSKN